MLSPNITLQNRYRIIRHLGQGGMGTVYEAIDERVSCIVAVKETLRGDKGAFKREAELLANLRHPSLPRVTDHFSVDEGSFLVMDFIPGHDLAELLELRGSPFPVAQVLGWADELLKVLEYLHRQGVLHRDIKPSNLKLMRTGEIFLLDFGLAKGAAGQMSTLTANRSVLGHTLTYASLEQIHGHGTDARSDLYSLGATLYHLLTGMHPIDAPTRDLALDEEQRDPLRPLHELNPQVSPAVSTVIHQAMAIRRKWRPENAAEMRRLLIEASSTAAPLAEEESANEERRQRAAEEEEVRRKREAANAATPVIPPTVASVPPIQKAATPVEASGTPAQTRTLQAPPPIFQYADSQSLSPVGTASHISRRGGSKSKWLLVVAAVGLMLIVVVIVVRMRIGTSTDNTAQDNASGRVPANISNNPSGNITTNTPKATPSPLPRTMKNSIGMEFVEVPAGSFNMGSENGNSDEKPVHWVTINYSFYMGKYEVTEAQWKQVMGGKDFQKCEQCPTINSHEFWGYIQEFIGKLNAKKDGYIYRLPTEAEWEYACRAGTTGDYAGNLDSMAWYANNSGQQYIDADEIYRTDPDNYYERVIFRNSPNYGMKSHPVGTKQANAFGLYDMHGNAWELCEDIYHDSYDGAPVDGSAWLRRPKASPRWREGWRVLRGGSLYDPAHRLRSAIRYFYPANPINGPQAPFPGDAFAVGFRVVAIRRDQ